MTSDWEVPSYDIYDLHSKTSIYCIAIPVLNEGVRIQAQLRAMDGSQFGHDIIIGDGGSTDGSLDLAFLKAHGVRALLVKTGPGRLSAQLRMLLAFALIQGYEGVITLDGNGKDGIGAIPSFIAALDAGWDFVQGSRYIAGGVARHTPLDREFGVRLIHAPLLSLSSGFTYTDTTNGFRAFSRRLLLDARVQPFRDVFDSYNLHYYLARRAARLRFRVKELPVARIYPRQGPTPTKISGLLGRLHLLKLLFLTVAGYYDPSGKR